jgi:hypothetical protein
MYKVLYKFIPFFKYIIFPFISILILYSAYNNFSSSNPTIDTEGYRGFIMGNNMLRRDNRKHLRRPSVYYGSPGFYRGNQGFYQGTQGFNRQHSSYKPTQYWISYL